METPSNDGLRKYPRKVRRSPWPRIDVAKWKAETKQLEADLRALKSVLRASGHQPTRLEYEALARLRSQATTLYEIRAASHGRLHNRHEALQRQAATVGDALAGFLLTAVA